MGYIRNGRLEPIIVGRYNDPTPTKGRINFPSGMNWLGSQNKEGSLRIVTAVAFLVAMIGSKFNECA